MPDLGAQARIPSAFTADFTVVRALLRHGCTYEKAVKSFEPYRVTQEPDPTTRDALRKIAEDTKNHDLERDLYIEEPRPDAASICGKSSKS